tara:strand:- start:15574 stop:15870 length:297 start_codon:yes stop_codon:yes gene_type:complete
MSGASVPIAAAVVKYARAAANVVLDYDTKNTKLTGDQAVLSDTSTVTYIMNLADALTADDLRWPYYSALLNGAPINTHALLWDGILNPRHEDVTITVS